MACREDSSSSTTIPKPNFSAEMFDWDFTVHPADADFAFSPPTGAKEVDFGAALSRQLTGASQ